MPGSELKLWYLKNLNIFKGMNSREMTMLDDITVMQNYTRREYIYFSREDSDRVYIVKQGHVEIGYLDESGKEFSLDILSPGEIFGTILGHRAASGYARALDRALLCIMSRSDFEAFLQRFPEMSFRVLKLLGSRINVLENKLQNLVFKDIKTRICDLIYSLYRKAGNPRDGTLHIALTHKDIANLVGCTRETASLNLSELKKEGIIDYQNRRIRVLSLPQLKHYTAIH